MTGHMTLKPVPRDTPSNDAARLQDLETLVGHKITALRRLALAGHDAGHEADRLRGGLRRLAERLAELDLPDPIHHQTRETLAASIDRHTTTSPRGDA